MILRGIESFCLKNFNGGDSGSFGRIEASGRYGRGMVLGMSMWMKQPESPTSHHIRSTLFMSTWLNIRLVFWKLEVFCHTLNIVGQLIRICF